MAQRIGFIQKCVAEDEQPYWRGSRRAALFDTPAHEKSCTSADAGGDGNDWVEERKILEGLGASNGRRSYPAWWWMADENQAGEKIQRS